MPATTTSAAQDKLLYAEIGGGLAYKTDRFLSFNMETNYVLNQENVLAISYSYISRNATNHPSDYEPGNSYRPKEYFKLLALMYGHMFKHKQRQLRFNIKAGIGGAQNGHPDNFVSQPDMHHNGLFNQTSDPITSTTISALILLLSFQSPGRVSFFTTLWYFRWLLSTASHGNFYNGVNINFMIGHLADVDHRQRSYSGSKFW